MRLDPSESFVKRFGKLKLGTKQRISRALEKFMLEPMPRSLDFRPLASALGFYIIDSSSGDRILLRKIADDHFEIVDFGPHDVYRRWNRRYS